MGQQASCPVTCTEVRTTPTLRRPWVETVQGESKGRGQRRRGTPRDCATESGWGEVLGLYVIQHTVRLTKLLTPAQ